MLKRCECNKLKKAEIKKRKKDMGLEVARVCLCKQVHVMICMESWVAVKDEAKMMLESNKKRGTIQRVGARNHAIIY